MPRSSTNVAGEGANSGDNQLDETASKSAINLVETAIIKANLNS